jgi:hypothetical protein
MKTVPKAAAVMLVIICAVLLGYGQEPTLDIAARARDEKLLPLLRPSDYAIDRAKEMGGEIFKLLPKESSTERGTHFGSSYSFKNKSYGRDGGQFCFAHGDILIYSTRSIAFLTDLGQRDLSTVDKSSPEADYFLSYIPPKLEPDIRSENERLKDINVGGVRLTRRVAPRVGNTYLLRSIEYLYSNDVAVVLHVVEKSTDGAITIVWKEIARFPEPIKLFMPDEEMQKKVDAVITELRMESVQVRVHENRIFFKGIDDYQQYELIKDAIHKRKIPYRTIGFDVMPRSLIVRRDKT